jgi:hypothetical protein
MATAAIQGDLIFDEFVVINAAEELLSTTVEMVSSRMSASLVCAHVVAPTKPTQQQMTFLSLYLA